MRSIAKPIAGAFVEANAGSRSVSHEPPTPRAALCGFVEDTQLGVIWFTELLDGRIGVLDPGDPPAPATSSR